MFPSLHKKNILAKTKNKLKSVKTCLFSTAMAILRLQLSFLVAILYLKCNIGKLPRSRKSDETRTLVPFR